MRRVETPSLQWITVLQCCCCGCLDKVLRYTYTYILRSSYIIKDSDLLVAGINLFVGGLFILFYAKYQLKVLRL